MALVVLTIISIAALDTLAAAADAELFVRQGDKGQLIANNTMEQAAAYDCGSTTVVFSNAGDLLAKPIVSGVLTKQLARCHGSLGDANWTVTDGPVTYSVAYRTNWVPFVASATALPTLRLRRDVDVSWTRRGTTRHKITTQIAALPPDSIGTTGTGSILLDVGANGSATIDLGKGFKVTHSAAVGDTRVRFAFLQAGVAYPIVVNGVSRGNTTATEVAASALR